MLSRARLAIKHVVMLPPAGRPTPSAASPKNTGDFRVVTIGALFPGVERGLAADILAAKALGGMAYPVCTSLLMAGNGTVTDSTDVPEDTVRAQLEHLSETVHPDGIKIGILASHPAAEAVLAFAESFEGPVVLDFQLSGPSGETVLTSRGIEAVMDRLSAADLLIVDRLDAEPISGGEIQSLDDAQVAAQRLVRRGARAVVIKCGSLPARFFETQGEEVDTTSPFNVDLFYDGEAFALFEAPHLADGHRSGASSAFAIAAVAELVRGRSMEEALQHAKRYVTEGLRSSEQVGLMDSFDYFWETRR